MRLYLWIGAISLAAESGCALIHSFDDYKSDTGGQGGTGASSVGCEVASDCPAPASECILVACTQGACVKTFMAAGTPAVMQSPGDCAMNVCDGAGGVVPAPDDTDLPVDDGNPCTQECRDGIVHVPLTGFEPCNDGMAGSCEMGTCKHCADQNICKLRGAACCLPTGGCGQAQACCSDGKLDGTETDVDCGGQSCNKCSLGRKCKQDSDCLTGFCKDKKECAYCSMSCSGHQCCFVVGGNPTCMACLP